MDTLLKDVGELLQPLRIQVKQFTHFVRARMCTSDPCGAVLHCTSVNVQGRTLCYHHGNADLDAKLVCNAYPTSLAASTGNVQEHCRACVPMPCTLKTTSLSAERPKEVRGTD